MTPVLRVGLLGCSSIARRRTLPALRATPAAAVTAVAARDPRRAEAFAAESGTGAAALTYEQLLAADDVDAVYVSLPNSEHHRWAEAALLAGKHVLCEKPMTTTAAATTALTRLAAERGLVLRENFTFLHHPQHARVQRLLADGRIGAPRTLTAEFCIPPLPGTDIRYRADLGGGALLDAGVYPLRLARLLLGPGLAVAGATLRVDKARDVDVAGLVLLVSPDGVFASLGFGFQHGYRSRYAVHGATGTLTADKAFTPPATWQPVLRVEEQDHTEEHTLPAADQFALAVAAFTTAALAGPDPTGAATAAPCTDTARLVDEVLATAVRVPDHEELRR
ncbi:Gfo/Idh/MocA family protein [Actinokineospora bangkokensis]|uniref:Gfo/Idh/MocA family protein n=1 Tax=Actinokineospora bangkokensis TaxID=1193682 RepID=UPI000A9CC024|nr:Gfo/Idh/MocA family oxidoreductase [Actinokineospora bangkokensis]